MARWRRYVPVKQRQTSAHKKLEALAKGGKTPSPIQIEGQTIARSFWGKGWCTHLEAFSDFRNRLPRGRTYVRNGSVVHLEILAGRVEAHVAGSKLYDVTIDITPLKSATWKTIKKKTSGQIGSVLELLQGVISDEVMTIVTDPAHGLFPKRREISLRCSCPDWAVMCKHVSAVLYGVGNRLDSAPELLFLLRGVDVRELVKITPNLNTHGKSRDNALADDQLGALFGVDIDLHGERTPPPKANGRQAKAKTTKAKTTTKPAKSTAAPAKQPRASKTPAKGNVKKASATPKRKSRPFLPTGKNIAALRRRLELTVPEFAAHLEVSSASVYRWERLPGTIAVRPGILERLQRAADEID